MKILGIETTCDETGIAVVEDGRKILSNLVASSADLHEKYGGVFPELAARRHMEVILPLVDEALRLASVTSDEIDLIAVARGPGLVGALLVGLQVAKGLSIAWNKPMLGINHVEAHLYAAMMEHDAPPLPGLGVVLSGGHTLLLKINDVGSYELLGTTVDDAIGEAFDKVGTLLGLSYPGGPGVERLAKKGGPGQFSFKAGHVKKSPLNFSFSGLKTSVLYALKDRVLSDQDRADAAYSFQETAFLDIARKVQLAAESHAPQAIFLGGGVCNNLRLRKILSEQLPYPLFWPSPELTLDNAAMIAALGYSQFSKNGLSSPLELEAKTRIAIA